MRHKMQLGDLVKVLSVTECCSLFTLAIVKDHAQVISACSQLIESAETFSSFASEEQCGELAVMMRDAADRLEARAVLAFAKDLA